MATAAWITVAFLAGWVSGMVTAKKYDGWLTGRETRKALRASRELLKKIDKEALNGKR